MSSHVFFTIKHPLVSQGRFEGLWSFQCLGPGPSSAGVQAESQRNPQRVGFLWHFSRFSWEKCGKLMGNVWQTWKTCRNNLKRDGKILRNYEKKYNICCIYWIVPRFVPDPWNYLLTIECTLMVCYVVFFGCLPHDASIHLFLFFIKTRQCEILQFIEL